MTGTEAAAIAERHRGAHDVPADATLELGERRFIELVTADQLVRDVLVRLVYFSFAHRHVELAVDEATGDIVRVSRSR